MLRKVNQCAMRLKLVPFDFYLYSGIPFSQRFLESEKSNHGLYVVHGFCPKSENFDFGKKMISSERASREEQNDANFSFIAPSSEEL